MHGVEGGFGFWSPGTRGPFAEWLWHRIGRESPLSRATEIEREAEAAGVAAVELFFSFLDEFRADRDRAS